MRERYFKDVKLTEYVYGKVDRVEAYLKKFPVINNTANNFGNEYHWVPKSRILTAARGSRMDITETVWKLLDSQVNIGKRWNKEIKDVEYRYYEPQEGDDMMQKSIDEF